MRARIGENQGNGFAGADGEVADGGHVLAFEMHRRAQHRHVRPGDSAQRAIFQARHPGHDGAVAETQHQLGMHPHLALRADDKAHDFGMIAARTA